MCNPYLAPLAPWEPGVSRVRRWLWMPVLVLAGANAMFWSLGPLLDGFTFLVYAQTMVSSSMARKINVLLSLVV